MAIVHQFFITPSRSWYSMKFLRLGLWRRVATSLAVAFMLLNLAGCAPAIVSPSPPPTSQGLPEEYRIQPGDQMDIKFFYVPELNESVTVRPDGRVSLQLAHDIPAAGLTPAELTQRLTKSYARELNQPQITVILRSFAGQRVYVDGEVNKPSVVELSAEMTLLQSITVAGGLKDTASTNEVAVIRRGPEGKPQVFTVDLTRARDGTNANQAMVLMPFDVIYVPKSTIANVNLWIDQYIRKNLPIGFGVTYEASSLQ